MTPMTADQAQTFDRFSSQNAFRVSQALGCGCRPYQDVFTYARWLAQGFHVQRGQHAVSLPIRRTVVSTDAESQEQTRRTVRGRAAVFCRCQVQPKETP